MRANGSRILTTLTKILKTSVGPWRGGVEASEFTLRSTGDRIRLILYRSLIVNFNLPKIPPTQVILTINMHPLIPELVFEEQAATRPRSQDEGQQCQERIHLHQHHQLHQAGRTKHPSKGPRSRKPQGSRSNKANLHIKQGSQRGRRQACT